MSDEETSVPLIVNTSPSANAVVRPKAAALKVSPSIVISAPANVPTCFPSLKTISPLISYVPAANFLPASVKFVLVSTLTLTPLVALVVFAATSLAKVNLSPSLRLSPTTVTLALLVVSPNVATLPATVPTFLPSSSTISVPLTV